MIENFYTLILLGFGIGSIGTLIGAGGGFILVPILILFYPEFSPEIITAISLAVVATNATVGSLSYISAKKVDFKAGIIFAIATVPGSIIGVFTTKYIPRHLFDWLFAALLITLAIFLFIRSETNSKVDLIRSNSKGLTHHKLTDKSGQFYEYAFSMRKGIIISILVGFFSPLLGIGGGIIHVPAMTHVLHFPVHLATATSHFILAIMSIVSVVIHAFEGHYSDTATIRLIIALVIGIIPGALIGARLSKLIKGIFIIRALSIALFFVAIRIILNNL
ncbi:MAG: sulfite exporter TauE/SafE family protein [Crocinitomicaceae bacterium]|nr:sulfite exporter TauE/SafE family protein [Crocinitomicaceae bacterium]